MEEKTSSSSSTNFESGFMWLATALGFIVDTITLVGLFSTFELKNVNAQEMSPEVQIPKIKIITATPGLKDSTLVLIVVSLLMLMLYIGIAFYKKEKKKISDDEFLPHEFELALDELALDEEVTITPVNKEFPLFFSIFGVSFFALISTLWILVFYFKSSDLWEYTYSVFAVWIIGTLFALIGVSLRSLDYNKMSKLLKTLLLVFVYSILPLGLIGEWLFHTTLLSSILAVIQITFLSVVYMVTIYILTALFSGITWMATKWFYNIN